MNRLLFILAVFLAGAGTAAAHAYVKTSDPAAGSTVKAAPGAVSIVFTEALEPKFSSLTVTDPAGKRVDLGDAHTDPADATHFAVGLKPLAAGHYTVIWQATAVDTHKTKGSFSFTVAP